MLPRNVHHQRPVTSCDAGDVTPSTDSVVHDDHENEVPLEDIAMLLSSSRLNASPDHVKPKLQVSESGKFQDQFYHAQTGSRAMGMLKNRMFSKKSDAKSDAIKRKKSATGKDMEQFSDSDIVYAGYLVKQGSFWKTWRRRYFILRRDIPVLSYYSSMENLTKLGEITIDGTTKVTPQCDDTFPFRFVVEHNGRKLMLVAEDGQSAMDTWIAWINNCIQKRANEATVLERNSFGSTGATSVTAAAFRSTGNGSMTEERVLLRRDSPHAMAIKRHPTDSVVIQKAAHDAMAARESVQVRRSNADPYEAYGSTPVPSSGRPPMRRLYRSNSAGSVLSTRSTDFEAMHLHDDCGIIKLQRSNHSSKKLTSDQTRARCLSLPRFKPAPSIELAISVGSKGAQDATNMLVTLSCIVSVGQTSELIELSRTEVQSCMSLRSCGGDFYARDFNALLSVPLNTREMLHFEIFSITNPHHEALSGQQSLGFVRISPMDLLFSRDSTLVLECKRSSVSTGAHFLVLDRIVPSESLNLGHSYTYAKRHFVADTVYCEKRKSSTPELNTTSAPGLAFTYGSMARGGKFDSQDANHVLISEELSSSYCSISVAVAYMKLVQGRNQRRIHDAKRFIGEIDKQYEEMPSSPCSKTQSVQTINLHSELVRDAQAKLAHYTRLYDLYVSCEEYYIALLAMLEEGKEPGITGCLKRSTQKKDKKTEFMPTNLNCHLIRAKRVILSSGHPAGAITPAMDSSASGSGAATDELVHAVITHGCTAAHTLGFKDGGLRRLQQLFAQSPTDQRLLERIEQRQDVVRCQVLALTAAAFLSVIGLAANKSAYHQERLKLICSTGFLVSTESLLSTVRSEKGMLEDMVEGMQWLNTCVSLQVVQSMEVNPLLKCSKCVAVTSSASGDQVVATFAIPSEVFATLPSTLQQGHAVKVHSVLFTQGINEMQSVANTMLDTSLQDEINYESVEMLERYFRAYQTQVKVLNDQDALNHDRIDELAQLQSDIEALVERLNQMRKSHVQKKNVNILLESSDICRRLGAGRTTCCKSGKDRTAMSVTLEASRLLVDRFHVKQGVQLCTAMRERGVRRVNVLVNTGKDKFAFNSLQLKCLPDCYKPPPSTADARVAS